MKTTSINFDEEILENLDEFAKKMHMSRSNALMLLLRENVILQLFGMKVRRSVNE